ncbi:hypothetical protein [Nitrosomonas sp. ANs5]|uniref:hypothetical protein n=1 Tax=Nitrosomonas sp. ANs5 TaxID=3423941 RepID=UPI003D3257C1
MKKLFTVLLAAVAGSMFAGPAVSEVIPGTNLKIDFHAGHVIGNGRHVNMLRVPVTDINTGQTTLFDASFRFSFLPNQGFTFEEIASVAISQPVQTITNIRTGLYRTQDNQCYVLEGPTILNDSRSLYTFRGVSHAGCGSADLLTAEIISGPANGHNTIGMRDIVPNLTDEWTYGFLASNSRGGGSSHIHRNGWHENMLIGIRQSGEQLILGRFTDEGTGADFRDPRQTVILTRVVQ